MQKLLSHQLSGKSVFKSSAVMINSTILKKTFNSAKKEKGEVRDGVGESQGASKERDVLC